MDGLRHRVRHPRVDTPEHGVPRLRIAEVSERRDRLRVLAALAPARQILDGEVGRPQLPQRLVVDEFGNQRATSAVSWSFAWTPSVVALFSVSVSDGIA